MYTFKLGSQEFKGKSPDETLVILRQFYPVAYRQLSSGYGEVVGILTMNKRQAFVSTVCDLFAWQREPDADSWKRLMLVLDQGLTHITRGNARRALQYLQHVTWKTKILDQELRRYVGGSITTGNRVVTVLEFVRDGAAVGVGIIAALPAAGIGLLGVASVSAGYTTVQSLAQQTSEYNYDLRDHIDWVGLGTDAVINLILNYFGGKLIGKLVGKLTIHPDIVEFSTRTARVLNNAVIRSAVANVFVNRLTGVVNIIIRNTIDHFRTMEAGKQPTWDMVLDQLAANFSASKLFFDLVSAEIGRRNPIDGHTSSAAHR